MARIRLNLRMAEFTSFGQVLDPVKRESEWILSIRTQNRHRCSG